MKQKVLLFMLLVTALTAKSADYYWVGGTGNWTQATTHWATTSGGSTFYSVVPTSADNVFFDANSFTAASQTVTINSGTPACNNMDWTGVTNTPTFIISNAFADGLNIYGSLTYVSGMTLTVTQPHYFRSTSLGKTITLGGKQMRWVYFEGAGGGWTFQDAFNTNEGVILHYGSINTNNQAVTIYYFQSDGANARSLDLGSSTVTISYSSPPWAISGSNCTLNAGTSNLIFTNGGAFSGGSKAYYNISYTAGNNASISGVTSANDISFTPAGTITGSTSTFNNVSFTNNGTINGSNTFNNLTFGSLSTYTLAAGTTQTVNGTITCSSSCSGLSTFKSSTSSPAIISKAAGSVSFDYVKLSNITATGGATYTANNAIATGSNTGWTINLLVAKTLYWVGGTGNWNDGSHWSLTSGGSAINCTATELDDVFFDANSFTAASQTVTINSGAASCNNMNWTGVLNTPTFVISNVFADGLNVYGSLTYVSGMNLTAVQPHYFRSTSLGKLVTLNNKQLKWAYFDGVGGGWTFQDAFNTSEGVFLTNGNLNTNNQPVTIYYFSSNNSNIRTLDVGSSSFILTYGQPWELGGTNLTYLSSSPTFLVKGGGNFIGGSKAYSDITFTGSSAATISGVTSANNVKFTSTATLSGAGATFNNVTFAGNTTINGSNTFNDLTLYAGTTITIQAGKTQTVNGTITAVGVSGLPIALTSTGSTSITKSSGTVCADYLSLTNISATGGAIFDAGTHSTNSGSSGFVFTGSCTLPSSPVHLWKGANTTWTTTTNWSPNIVPTATTNALIENSVNPPTISTTQPINNLLINSGGALTVSSSGTLQLSGTLTNNGTLTATAGTVEFNGSAPQTIPAAAFATNTIKNLTINNATGVTLAGALNVTGIVTPTSGTLTTGGNLTLISNNSGTARIAQGAGSYIFGTVNVQQYIPGGRRAYRFLGNPFNASLNMGSLIDNIYITGDGTTAGTGGATTGTGFDATSSNAASSYWFDNTTTLPGSWKAFTGTADNSWAQYKGVRVLIRGDRTQPTALTGSNPTPNAVTLDMTGTLNTGNVSMAVPTVSAFHLLSNPYASPVDIGTVIDGLTSGVIGTQYWVWNANAAGINNRGAYVTKVVGTGAYNLAANGAFLVQPVSGTTLSFTEANKQSTASTALFRTNTMQDLLELNLLYNNGEADNMFIRNALTASNALDAQDGEKLLNPDINFYSLSSTANKLSLDSRPFVAVTTIPLGFTTTAAGTFSIAIANNTINSAIAIYVKDKLLNTEQLLTPSTAFTFTVTTDPATQGENRFELIFRNNAALPATITNLKAYQKNTGIQVEWDVLNELNLNSYEIEKSINGIQFTKAGTVQATSNVAYHWFDVNALQGNNYYRIKAIGKNGEAQYTQIVNVKIGGAKNNITVVGNPAKNKTILLQLENVDKGKFSIKIFNSIGQQVANKNLLHNGGSATEAIQLNTIAAGTYYLSVIGDNHVFVSHTIIVE